MMTTIVILLVIGDDPIKITLDDEPDNQPTSEVTESERRNVSIHLPKQARPWAHNQERVDEAEENET